MARPKGGYCLKDGTRIPSVTTVISRFKASGGLIHWAWQQGRDGLDYRETRDKAADAGTCAHAMVECDIRQLPFNVNDYQPDVIEKASGAFNAYTEWKDQTQLVPVATEVSLVSEEYGFGGTLDAMLINGKLALGDWKTANAVYHDNLMQLAAYKGLWEEHHPDRPVEGGFHLLRFSKQKHPDDPVSFAHHYWSSLDLAWEQFLLLLHAYRNDKRLKDML